MELLGQARPPYLLCHPAEGNKRSSMPRNAWRETFPRRLHTQRRKTTSHHGSSVRLRFSEGKIVHHTAENDPVKYDLSGRMEMTGVINLADGRCPRAMKRVASVTHVLDMFLVDGAGGREKASHVNMGIDWVALKT